MNRRTYVAPLLIALAYGIAFPSPAAADPGCQTWMADRGHGSLWQQLDAGPNVYFIGVKARMESQQPRTAADGVSLMYLELRPGPGKQVVNFGYRWPPGNGQAHLFLFVRNWQGVVAKNYTNVGPLKTGADTLEIRIIPSAGSFGGRYGFYQNGTLITTIDFTSIGAAGWDLPYQANQIVRTTSPTSQIPGGTTNWNTFSQGTYTSQWGTASYFGVGKRSFYGTNWSYYKDGSTWGTRDLDCLW